MGTNIANLSTSSPNANTDGHLRAWQAERTALAAVSNEQHMDVTLMTDEGDKVTLSMDARAAAMYGAYEQAGADGQGFFATKAEFSIGLYEREMTFTVEGELSAEEQKEIGQALKTLDRMMHNFVNGDVKPMLAQAGKLQGLDSLASIEAHMSYERTVVVASQSRETAVHRPASQTDAALSDGPDASLESKADALGAKMAQEIAAAQTPADRMLALVDQLFDDYRQRMAEMNSLGGRMIDRVAGRLRKALAQHAGLGANRGPRIAA